MEEKSIKKIVGKSAGSPRPSEMPETPALKLPEGISTATRKKFLPSKAADAPEN